MWVLGLRSVVVQRAEIVRLYYTYSTGVAVVFRTDSRTIFDRSG